MSAKQNAAESNPNNDEKTETEEKVENEPNEQSNAENKPE